MQIEKLTKMAFVPFGGVLSRDDTVKSVTGADFTFTPNIHIFDAGQRMTTGILEGQRRELKVIKAERHLCTSEVCVALENDAIIIVAEPGEERPDADSFHAFYLKQGDGVIFAPGAWHWIPYPIKNEVCRSLIIYKENTAEADCEIMQLAESVTID